MLPSRFRIQRLCTCLFAAFLLLNAPAPGAEKPLALIGGRVHTQTKAGTIEATVLIRDGKIAAVGRDVEIPADTVRIDARKMIVTPGLIDAAGKAWLTPAACKEGSSSGNLNVVDGVDRFSEDWKEIIRQGVTTVYVQPASSGLLGGRGAVLRVAPGSSVAELVIKADAALQAALGTQTGSPRPATPQPTSPFGRPPTPPQSSTSAATPMTRQRDYARLKKAFDDAKKHGDALKQYEEKKKKGDKTAKKPNADPVKELLLRVLAREIPLRLEAHHSDDVGNALKLAAELKLRLVLDGASDPKSQTAKLSRVPLVLGPVTELESTPAYRKGRPGNYLKSLAKDGTPWALATFSSQPRSSRLLRVQAAAAVAQGIDRDAVLRAITSNAAEILGVADRLGTIAPGKQADLVVFAGDPLDPSTRVRLVVSSGKIVHDEKAVRPPVETIPTVTKSGLPKKLPAKFVIKTTHLLTKAGEFHPRQMLVANGKIVAVGETVEADANVPVFDVGSAVVTPGLVAACTDMGLASAIDEKAESDAGFLRSIDAYDPECKECPKLVRGGFLTAVLTPGSSNVIGGTASALRLGSKSQILAADVGTKLNLTSSSRNNNRYPASLAGQVELIDNAFAGNSQPLNLYLPELVRKELEAERQKYRTALLEGKQVALIEAESRAEVEAALRLVRRHKLRAALVGPEELTPHLGELAQLRVGIVAKPVKVDDYDRQLTELVRAAAEGIPVAFGCGSAFEMRMAASLAVNAGMKPDAALRGLTASAAEMNGMPKGAATLAAGRPADFVVWSGSPLDLGSKALNVVINGKQK